MLLQTILHGLRAIALLFALASRVRMLPHVKNEEHVMSIHSHESPVLVSYSVGFRVTFCATARRMSSSFGSLQRCQSARGKRMPVTLRL